MNNLQEYFELCGSINEQQKEEILTRLAKQNDSKSLKLLMRIHGRHPQTIEEWRIFAKVLKLSLIDCWEIMETKKQCFQYIKIKWGKQQDELLKKQCLQQQISWEEILNKIKEQTNIGFLTIQFLKDRWFNKIHPSLSKAIWKQIEETQLLKCILNQGKKWDLIAAEMKHTRNVSQIKSKYFNILRQWESKYLNNSYISTNSPTLYQLEVFCIQSHLSSFQQQQKNQQQKKAPKKKEQKTHAKNIVNKILRQYQQDDHLDYSKMKDHFQDVVAQKGDTVELDEEPISNSNNLSDVQFAVMGKDQQNLHVFPKSQLKAVMDLLKRKKDENYENPSNDKKSDNQQQQPFLPKVEIKQQKQSSQQQQLQQQQPAQQQSQQQQQQSQQPVQNQISQQIQPSQTSSTNQPMYQLVYPYPTPIVSIMPGQVPMMQPQQIMQFPQLYPGQFMQQGAQMMPIGYMPMGQMGQVPVGQVPVAQMPVGQMGAGQIPTGQIPTGQIPIGQIAGQYPIGITGAQMQGSQIQNGQITPGQVPIAQIPANQMPINQMPGQFIQLGQMPLGQLPNPTQPNQQQGQQMMPIMGAPMVPTQMGTMAMTPQPGQQFIIYAQPQQYKWDYQQQQKPKFSQVKQEEGNNKQNQ